MRKNVIDLTNCTAILRYEHENYKNGKLRITVNYKGSFLVSSLIKDTVLSGNDAAKKILNQLNSEYTFKFTKDDCDKIVAQAKNLMKSGQNITNKSTVDAVLRKIYRFHLANYEKYHMSGLEGEKQLTYIRKNENRVYLCIQYKDLSYIFERIGESWKSLDFRRDLEMIYDVWENGGTSHDGLYQNKAEKIGWSIRVPLKEIIRGKEVA